MAKVEHVKRVENRINDDAIWRQIIETEVFGSLSRVTFLNGNYINNPNMLDVDAKKSARRSIGDAQHQFKSGLPSLLPCGLTSPDTIESDLLYTGQIKQMIVRKAPYEKYSYPTTAAQQIGWPFSGTPGDGQLLERYGRAARGKKDFNKILCGVYEAQERMRAQQ